MSSKFVDFEILSKIELRIENLGQQLFTKKSIEFVFILQHFPARTNLSLCVITHTSKTRPFCCECINKHDLENSFFCI